MNKKAKKYLINTQSGSPNTGTLLTTFIKKNRIYQNALARKLGRSTHTVYAFRKRTSIQTAVLWEFCHALNYNFFSDIAAQLPPQMPCATTLKDQRIAELEKQVQELTTERNNLKQVVEILRQK